MTPELQIAESRSFWLIPGMEYSLKGVDCEDQETRSLLLHVLYGGEQGQWEAVAADGGYLVKASVTMPRGTRYAGYAGSTYAEAFAKAFAARDEGWPHVE